MAGLFIVQARDPDFAQAALAGARDQFARHGFVEPFETVRGGWHVLHAGPILGGPANLLVEGDDLVAIAGTLTCDGEVGTAALRGLLAMAPFTKPDWSRLGGQFAAFVRSGGRSFLFTDHFAAFQLFHDTDMRLFSTSLLSAVRALPRLSFDAQNVYEFAFNVMPIGDDTVLSQVKRLGPDKAAELEPDRVLFHDLDKPLPVRPAAMPLPDRIALHRERLRSVLRPYVRHFGDRLCCPLSGGLDSRLLLAALRAEGVQPSVYVYGSAGDADVRVAESIGAAQGFDVERIDKETYRSPAPDEFAEQVGRNFDEYDGLPNFGTLFDNGGNAFARNRRHQDGALAASGGCGEIYRNFFFLPNRPTTAAAVARSFFARYTPGDATGLFDELAFLRNIEDKILGALGLPGIRSPLPRAVIEQVYPRVRCRALFGKEISDEGRYGAYLMPFLDHNVAAAGIELPMALKNSGRFEAILINAIDPALAAEPSAYGHNFAGPPSLAHRFSEWSTRVRPAWLRQRSYAIQRRLGPVADEHGGLLSEEYLGRVIDLEYPIMRRFFRPERIAQDSGLMRRIACLELFAERLGSKLRS